MGGSAIRALCAGLLVATLTPQVDSAQCPIAQVEVSARVARSGRDLVGTIRSQVHDQLATVDWGRSRAGDRFILTATLVRLDTDAVAGGSKARCSVSIVLRESRRGALRAVIESGARAEGFDASRAEDEALRAAVRGAVGRVPEALAAGR